MAWKKGKSGNPSGRKRSNWRKLFDAAIEADTAKHKQSIFEHAIKESRSDNTLLAAILRKCLPDMKTIEAKIDSDSPYRLVIELPKPDVKELTGSESLKLPDKVTSTK